MLNLNMDEVIETIHLSLPDSLGKQHPVKVTTTTRTYTSNEDSKTVTKANTQVDKKDTLTIIDNSRMSTDVDSDIETEETIKYDAPFWMKGLVWVVLGVVIFFIYLIMKRWHIL